MKRKVIGTARRTALILAGKVVVFRCLFALRAFIANVSTALEANDMAVFKNDLDITTLQKLRQQYVHKLL